MILSVAITAALAGAAMVPGWLLVRPHAAVPGARAAAAAASLAAMLLLTALAGAGAGMLGLQLSAAIVLPISLAAAVGAALGRGRAAARTPADRGELAGWLIALVLAGYGLASLAASLRETADGALLIHAWYNADWFKHMGHVHALANWGVPARDGFGGAGPLHYYWLIYILPGAAANLGAEPWAALSTFNAVIAALLGLLIYAAVRLVVPSPTRAAALTLTGFVVLAPAAFFIHLIGGGTIEAVFASGLTPAGSALLGTAQVIPQHALAAALLCSWIILCQPADPPVPRAVKVLALAALAAVLTISTLLGAVCLLAYGLARLFISRARAVPELAAMVIASAALVLVLGVIKAGSPDSAIASPLLTNAPDPRPGWMLALAALSKASALVGVPLLLVIPFLLRLRAQSPREHHAMIAAYAMIAACALAIVVSQLALPVRVAEEIFIRTKIPLSIAVLLLGGLVIERRWHAGAHARRLSVAALAVLALVAAPSIYALARWEVNFGDSYTTRVPAQDRAVLARLRANSSAAALVWQYPEKPLVGEPSGDDNWSAILAGRTVPNSERATDYARAAPVIARATRWFAGEPAAIPAAIDWVYLSRALHPDSYDALVRRMAGEPGFVRHVCYADACLFRRTRANSP
jgi:hypothetical protein